MSVEEYIKENIELLGNTVYIVPNIDEKKLNNAIKSIAPNVNPDFVLGIVDFTLLGNSKQGVLFTGESIHIKYSFSESMEFMYEDISSAEIRIREKIKKNEEIQRIKEIYFILDDGQEQLIEVNASSINQSKLVDLINEIIELGKEGLEYKSTNHALPLADMDFKIRNTYIKILINLIHFGGLELNSKIYVELTSLMVRLDYDSSNRLEIRSSLYNVADEDNSDELLDYMLEMVPEGSFQVIKQSLVKDMLNLYKVNFDINTWSTNDFINNMKERFAISDEQVSLIINAIQQEEKLLKERITDKQFKKHVEELAAKSSAVGVPLAAIYLSGSVAGMSAAGLTSGLAALGLKGFLVFSPMVTGIGVAVIMGVGAYKGVKKIAGISEIEDSKQRELMLQEIIKNSQRSIEYLVEDINAIILRMNEELAKANLVDSKVELLENTLKKLMFQLSITSKGAQDLTDKTNYVEKEAILSKLPKVLNKGRLEELTNVATKKKIREFILASYYLSEETDNEDKEELRLNEELKVKELEDLYNSLMAIGYFNVTEASLASFKSNTKKLFAKNLDKATE